jgi:hypothetical protein
MKRDFACDSTAETATKINMISLQLQPVSSDLFLCIRGFRSEMATAFSYLYAATVLPGMAVRWPSSDQLEASEALKTFLAKSSEWVLCHAFLLPPPASQLPWETEIQIRLKNDRLDRAFLCFFHGNPATGVQARFCGIFPISRLLSAQFELSSRVDPSGHLVVTFYGDNDQRVIFFVRDLTGLELLVSQIRVCSPISAPDDRFERTNAIWFRQAVQDCDVYREFCSQHKLIEIDRTGCALCPVTYSVHARDAWLRRCETLNRPFYTVFGTIRVTCMTWNVASRRADLR